MLSLWVNEWIPICQPLPFLPVFLFLCAASASLNTSWSPLPLKSRLFISVHSNTLYRFTVCRIWWVVWFRKLRRSTKELGDNVHTCTALCVHIEGTQHTYSHIQETLNHKIYTSTDTYFTCMNKHAEESLKHKTCIHEYRENSVANEWKHTYAWTHTHTRFMRPDEDKCSINNSNSGIISFLRFTANITSLLALSLHGKITNRVSRLGLITRVACNGWKTHTEKLMHTCSD